MPSKDLTRRIAQRGGMTVAGLALVGLMSVAASPASADITLVGASQFDENHAFTKTMRKFEELVQACYTDEPVNFELHLNSELGLEKDYVAYMNQGLSVDYAVASPAHMSTFSKMAPLMDMPFLFRDEDHWQKVLEQDGLKPVADDILKTADVILLGYAGGGTRNVFANKKISNLEEMQDLPIRMQGAPIWTRVFDAIGAAPTVIAYNEVYNGISTGVIEAAENEAAGIEQMKFYEVGPDISLTQHAITVRPIAFSGKTMDRLPEDLQACVRSAGMEAGKYGREIESSEDSKKLEAMESQGLLKTHAFTERDKLLELAEPVKRAYA
ncbi:MAG: TRAP transporter substrate-binding protein, partial [Bauldia litoralis]